MKFEKPVIKVEGGMAFIDAKISHDGDNDGKNSIEGTIALKGDAVELIGELMKKEPNSVIAMILQNLKV